MVYRAEKLCQIVCGILFENASQCLKLVILILLIGPLLKTYFRHQQSQSNQLSQRCIAFSGVFAFYVRNFLDCLVESFCPFLTFQLNLTEVRSAESSFSLILDILLLDLFSSCPPYSNKKELLYYQNVQCSICHFQTTD